MEKAHTIILSGCKDGTIISSPLFSNNTSNTLIVNTNFTHINRIISLTQNFYVSSHQQFRRYSINPQITTTKTFSRHIKNVADIIYIAQKSDKGKLQLHIYSCGEDGLWISWKRSGQIRRLCQTKCALTAIAVPSDEARVFVGNARGRVEVYHADDKKYDVPDAVEVSEAPVTSICLAEDGCRILAGCEDGDVVVVELPGEKGESEAASGQTSTESTDGKSKVQNSDDKNKGQNSDDKNKGQSTDDKNKVQNSDDKSKDQSTDDKNKGQNSDDKNKVQSTDDKSKDKNSDDKSNDQSTDDKSKGQSTDDKNKVQNSDGKSNVQDADDILNVQNSEDVLFADDSSSSNSLSDSSDDQIQLARRYDSKSSTESMTMSTSESFRVSTSDSFKPKMKEARRIHAHDGAVTRVVIAPDQKTFVTTSADGTAKLWSFPECEKRFELKCGGQWVWDACYAGKSEYVVTGGSDGKLRAWSVADGSMVEERKVSEKGITALAAVEAPVIKKSKKGKE